jgi:hypothetical protein
MSIIFLLSQRPDLRASQSILWVNEASLPLEFEAPRKCGNGQINLTFGQHQLRLEIYPKPIAAETQRNTIHLSN